MRRSIPLKKTSKGEGAKPVPAKSVERSPVDKMVRKINTVRK